MIIYSVLVHMIAAIVHSMSAALDADSIGHSCHTVAVHNPAHPSRVARTVCIFWKRVGHVYPQ